MTLNEQILAELFENYFSLALNIAGEGKLSASQRLSACLNEVKLISRYGRGENPLGVYELLTIDVDEKVGAKLKVTTGVDTGITVESNFSIDDNNFHPLYKMLSAATYYLTLEYHINTKKKIVKDLLNPKGV